MQRVFENESFVAVDKPAGWLTVPSRMGKSDPRPCLGPALEAELSARLWPVHRLDLEVSGLVLFARHAEAHRAASSWFENHRVHKRYEALTERRAPPPPLQSEVVWQSKLLRGKKRSYESPHGKEATTKARCLGGEPLRWELWPETGRPHQLRVHLSRAGFPILGDALYGAEQPFTSGIALRAVQLDFSDCEGRGVFDLPDRLEVPGLSST